MNSDESEKLLIAACLAAASPRLAVVGDAVTIQPDDFAHPLWRQCWRFMIDIGAAGDEPEQMALHRRFLGAGRQDEATEVALLGEGTPRHSNLRSLVRAVVDASAARRLQKALTASVRHLEAGATAAQVAEQVRASVDAALNRVVESPLRGLMEFVGPVVDGLDAARRDRGVSGLRSGIQMLDELLGGWRGKRLYLVAARTSDGKTTMASQLAVEFARQGARTALLSLEMDSETLLERMGVRESQTQKYKLFSREGEHAYELIAAGVARAGALPILVCDRPAMTVDEIRAACAAERMRGGLGAIIVDHAQIVGIGDKDDTRYMALRLIAEALRAMAREWDVPVVLMAQLNPQQPTKDGTFKDRAPRLGEVRESADIGNTVDAGILIWQTRDEHGEVSSTKLLVAKNRHGRRGTIEVNFRGDLHEFAEEAWSGKRQTEVFE